MQPYYSDERITIYHGDCRELLPELFAAPWRLASDPSLVLVTDPPYGVDFDGKKTKHTKKRSGGYTTRDDASAGPDILRVSLPHVTRAAVFCGTVNLVSYPSPQDIGCIYCPSGAGIGRWGFTCFHPILLYGPRPDSVLMPTSIQSFAVTEPNGHPCPKPLRWLTWLLGLCSRPGETILDPFAGSGTTLRAAKDLGRRAIGIEVEERYCEIAVRQLGQEVIELTA